MATPENNNNRALFLASFMTLIAAGVGFAIRAGVLIDWGTRFGFTKGDLGSITGGGLVGFGLTIIICSFVADKVGYKRLMVLAFVLHILSAVLTVAATPVFTAMGKDAAFFCLYWGMFMFALANGVCESVINPLVATLYPKQKTHYLNILHAGWPGGLILGGLLAYMFVGPDAKVMHLPWEFPIAFFLIPTLYYGYVILKEEFPHSEAKAAGVEFGKMLKEFAAPMLLFLFLLHAMVGYVELGTDSWITNIMGNVIEQDKAILLFVYTSAIMFVLRFFAGPIVERINPIGLLLISSVLGCVGLYALGKSEAVIAIILAATVYGVGKTFLWPTMLGVVGERFPKGGALTMGTIGGIGMLSAGWLGGPGIGYKQDYYATQKLEQVSPETYERYVSSDDNKRSFLFFPAIAGLDGTKVGALEDKGADLEARIKALGLEGKSIQDDKTLAGLQVWWEEAKNHVEVDGAYVLEANIYGGRMALKWTALVPLMMAIGYLILALYFRSKGGYSVEVLHGEAPDGEKYTGGVEGPVE